MALVEMRVQFRCQERRMAGDKPSPAGIRAGRKRVGEQLPRLQRIDWIELTRNGRALPLKPLRPQDSTGK